MDPDSGFILLKIGAKREATKAQIEAEKEAEQKEYLRHSRPQLHRSLHNLHDMGALPTILLHICPQRVPSLLLPMIKALLGCDT